MKSPFSSSINALVLGVGLLASAGLASISYAQLVIPTNSDNAVIAIQKIFLSPNGTITPETGKPAISLIGTDSPSIKLQLTQQILGPQTIITHESFSTAKTSIDAKGISGNALYITENNSNVRRTTISASGDSVAGINTPNATVRNSLTVNNQTTTQTLKVAQHASITGNLFVNNDALITGDLMVKTLAGNCISSSGNNTSCRAKITPNGTLVRSAIEPGDIEGWDEPDLVFARGENKNFFADTNGSPSSVSKTNFLRVGITEMATPLQTNDMGMMVGGVIESRGGLIIKKIDGQDSNSVANQKVNPSNNYTSMNTHVDKGEIYFDTRWYKLSDHDTKIVFSNKGSSNKATVYADEMAIGFLPNHDLTPGSKLDINGAIRANAYYYNSDIRYKSDIAPLDNALVKLSKLNGYSYYNKLSEQNDIGVIAQEVEKVFPELVQTDREGYKTVSYGNLVAPIISAINELADQVDSLFNKYLDQQKQINNQQAQINELKASIKALQNK